MAYSVSQRTREIGIRVALGADRSDVIGMVVGKGMTMVAVGVGLGLAASIGASRLMAGLIYGVSAVDPITFVGVPGLLCLVALAATFLPAWRAASVHPMVALRAQ
jgi:putative ABC transport system permease protein